MRIRREVVGALSAVFVAACSAVSASPSDPAASPATPPPFVDGVGVLPTALPISTVTPEQIGTDETSTSTTTTTTEPFVAAGNRILMIGDSILATTSSRYSNDMCKALVPMGWQVAIEAEVSRGIDFAKTVWRERGDERWDVVLVFLGTNYGGDENDHLRRLNTMITDAGDAEVVLVTVSEYEPEQHEVNTTIRAIADVYDNVSVLEWSELTADEPTLLDEDGIHPTTEGRKVLAGAVAFHLGQAPASPGRCLDSVFHDDSAGAPGGKPIPTTVKPNPSGSTTTVKPVGGVTTTTKPATSTTVGGGSSSTTPTTTVSTTATTAPVTTPTTPPITIAPP